MWLNCKSFYVAQVGAIEIVQWIQSSSYEVDYVVVVEAISGTV